MVEVPPGFADPVLVGRGAMAEVYRVRHLDLDRWVALKRMRVPAPPDRARFAREIALLARLADPHIVRLHDGGVAGDQPYLITELVDGPDLEALGPTALHVPLVLDVLSGLAYLHGQGVVHRDVKPANVLVPREGPAKLADFGLARGDDSDPLTAAGAVPGTPMYLAPERLLGAPATPASDLYAVGVMLHLMLTGTYPAGLRGDANAFVAQRVGMDAAPVRLAHPDVPAPLAALVDRLLARLPEARGALEAALRGDAKAGAPPARPAQRPSSRPRLSSLAGPVFAGFALLMTAAVLHTTATVVQPPAGAPAGPLLDPAAVHFERDPAGIAVTFSTARPARATVRSHLGRVVEERAGLAHRLLIEGAPLDSDLALELSFDDERAPFPFRLASPLVALERACAGLDAERLEAVCAEVRSGPADAVVRAATLERELVRSGYRAALPLATALRGPLLHGAPAPGAPATARRARLLTRLARLRRLDRLAARLKLPFSTGVEALLGEEFALVDARVTSASIPLSVPAGTWLEQSGMHTREVTDPGWRDAAEWPLAAAPARGGTAALAIEVDALAPDACVIAAILPAGLELELWAPLDRPGATVLAHRFDAAFLTGQDRVRLSMGLADGGFAPDRLVALHVSDRAEIVRRGLGCTVRRAGLELPR